jgi:hypothetical protein
VVSAVRCGTLSAVQHVTVRLPRRQIAAIDAIATEQGITRSSAMRRLLDKALGEPPGWTPDRIVDIDAHIAYLNALAGSNDELEALLRLR